MRDALELMRRQVVGIVRLEDLSGAVELAGALLGAGVRVIEFPLTNDNAMLAVRAVRTKLPAFDRGEALLGTGSVLSVGHVEASAENGAQFVVAPVVDVAVIEAAGRRGIPAIPGGMTPTEVLAAHRAGAAAVKVFPARGLGPAYVTDLLEPLPFLKLVPTGGITETNVREYWRAGAFAVGAGSVLLDKDAIGRRDWEAVSRRARAMVAAASES